LEGTVGWLLLDFCQLYIQVCFHWPISYTVTEPVCNKVKKSVTATWIDTGAGGMGGDMLLGGMKQQPAVW
jgi:hypothetical protein